MLPITLQYMKENGYTVFEKGHHNLNIVGIRSKERKAGKYDDLLSCIYKNESGQWVTFSWRCTTDPGLYYLKNPMRVEGTAILVPGQYRGAWEIGLHKGKYTALVQRKKVRVYRDADRDDDLDLSKIQEGLFGINIHRPFSESDDVGKNSAGCQVFASRGDFSTFMHLVGKSSTMYGTTFTYTLLNQWW